DEAGEGIERFLVFSLPLKAESRPNPRQIHSPDRLPLQVAHPKFRFRILQIAQQKPVIHNRHLLQFVLALRYHSLPTRTLHIPSVNREELSPRRLQNRPDPEPRTIDINE